MATMEKLPRMNLVNTAAKFLQNPKVQESSRQDQKTFLEKKGLTKDEIELAFEEFERTDFHQGSQVSIPQQSAEVAPVSLWSKLREHFVSFVIVGGVSYAVYKLVKTYIIPLLWDDPQEKRLQSLEQRSERHLALVEDTMKQMREMMEMMRDEIRQQNTKIDALNRSRGTDDANLHEIKTGITTLKGLLLNRRQFPPTPVSQPIIPSWQRESPPRPDGLSSPPRQDGLSSPLSSPSTSPSQEQQVKVTSSWVTVDASPSRNSDDVNANVNNGDVINDDDVISADRLDGDDAANGDDVTIVPSDADQSASASHVNGRGRQPDAGQSATASHNGQ